MIRVKVIQGIIVSEFLNFSLQNSMVVGVRSTAGDQIYLWTNPLEAEALKVGEGEDGYPYTMELRMYGKHWGYTTTVVHTRLRPEGARYTRIRNAGIYLGQMSVEEERWMFTLHRQGREMITAYQRGEEVEGSDEHTSWREEEIVSPAPWLPDWMTAQPVASEPYMELETEGEGANLLTLWQMQVLRDAIVAHIKDKATYLDGDKVVLTAYEWGYGTPVAELRIENYITESVSRWGRENRVTVFHGVEHHKLVVHEEKDNLKTLHPWIESAMEVDLILQRESEGG